MPKQTLIKIAIDGYSSCGKSTFAKTIAKKYRLIYIDSGAMYRTVTLFSLQHGFWKNGQLQEDKLKASIKEIHITFRKNTETGDIETYMNDIPVEKEIRSQQISDHVSEISTLPFVREKLVALQREFAQQQSVVMDGRDIGTVVFPDAEIKIFMTASPEIRAKRRFDEMQAKNIEISFDEVWKNVQKRDKIDSEREMSPLKQAEDAAVLDNSRMTPEGQMVWFDMNFRHFFSTGNE